MTGRGWRVGFSLLAAAIAVAAAVVVVGAVWWWGPPVGLAAWRAGVPPTTWAARQRQEERWRTEGLHRQVEHHFMPLADISPDVALAVLVNEDIDFFGHGPFDFRALREVGEAVLGGGRLRGASTIAQQLARTLFLSNERTVWRKLSEARVAWWLERRLGKRRVLELYLNTVEFGPGLFGVDAAAQHYFGISAASVDARQAAVLAASIPSPGRDNPATASKRWQARVELILARMGRAGWLRDLLAAVRNPG
jgi:monofunctional biosynthetic peptidoglycan transglycosylase